ncbi:MAG: NAD(P)H-dependent oxidoreductase [Pseudomonadota bacterium]
MARVLIVLAHPDADSLAARWAGESAKAARGAAHDVLRSDLYAMDFDPVERMQGAAPDAEVEKMRRADWVLFHFPLWWFGPPAILKGWIDRVLFSDAYFASEGSFESGPLAGKRAVFCVSTAASALHCGPSGQFGDARMQLWPLAHALRYAGVSVLEPYIIPGIGASQSAAERILMDGQIARVLADEPKRMAAFDRLPVWASNPSSNFDASGRLVPDAPVYSAFIRHDDGSY